MGLFFFIKFNENSPSEENTYVYARLGFRFSWVLARFRYPVGLFFFIMFMYFPPVCSDAFLMLRRTLGMQPFGAGQRSWG